MFTSESTLHNAGQFYNFAKLIGFRNIQRIQNPKEEIYGPAHNSILQVPGKDKWYIVYHRINKNHLNDGPGWHREVCIDRMEFNPDGTIKQVIPTP